MYIKLFEEKNESAFFGDELRKTSVFKERDQNLFFTDFCLLSDRDEDPDPVGSGTFFDGSGSGSYL